MDQQSSVRLIVNDTHVIAYFATNLAITFIRRLTAEESECQIRPVYGPDISFTDPATSRVHLIEGVVSLPLHYAGQQTVVTAYVVQNEEIGVPIVLGMDSIIALQGRLLSQDGAEEMNPHYPIPGEEDLTAPRPIYSTGLTVSMASIAWQQQSVYEMEPGQDVHARPGFPEGSRIQNRIPRRHHPVTTDSRGPPAPIPYLLYCHTAVESSQQAGVPKLDGSSLTDELAPIHRFRIHDCRLLLFGYASRFFSDDWELGGGHVGGGVHAALSCGLDRLPLFEKRKSHLKQRINTELQERGTTGNFNGALLWLLILMDG
ncbi:hypothetical protein DAPPUDRAFT_115336 [Daphnia pulex]|uniref:Uncharacterized protein n=1 Tax=Daphnia pulex TaxID=6669 RepID=E9HL12_DAPPU|nr:hypothetical protein DAPPUDRAFT_115336 [Daphnia pulex]|eukprot:EFX67576.1 hypothetical protein DAPPUDRAFT_115336 [Daphnia pulex]